MRSVFYKKSKDRALHSAMGCLALYLIVVSSVPNVYGHYSSTIGINQGAMQTRITGSVTDASGIPLAGVTVKEQGTTSATTTDEQGQYSLALTTANAVVTFSFIGFVTQEVTVNNQSVINVTLEDDVNTLEELVVIGYGTQKKKLITGATIQVKGEDLQKLSTSSVLGALQSQSPGVQITQSSGMPGQGFKVTVRGIGTIGNSSPLYVIDGVAGGDINMLNPSDIESVDILKDAASAAIYGARAANGVVLVTTKQGKVGKLTLSYDTYLGMQNAYKMPSLLTAKEYMAIQDERRFNEGLAPYDWATLIPNQYEQAMAGTWNGTNWLREIHNDDAITQNHAVNLMGGGEQSRFSLGYSLAIQDGIFGKPVSPNSERHTVRLNSEHIILKNDDFDVIKFGENVTYAYNTTAGIGIGNIYWNDIHNMLVGNPLLPVYNADGGYYDHASKVADGWAFDGATANPIADMHYRRGLNRSKNHTLMTNAYLEIQPIENLKFRSNFGYRLQANAYRSYTPAFQLSTTSQNAVDDISQNQGQGYNWILENTIAYQWALDNSHNFDAVIGQSVERWGLGEDLSATTANSSFPGSWQNAWVINGQGYDGFTPTVGGQHWPDGVLASFFGRVNYNYKETYMASLIMRADGSSNFARGNRWGYFPSAAAGWVLTNESFMQSSSDWLNFFKIRASWGQNGNSSIDPFQYLATIAITRQSGYYFGNNKNTLVNGAYPDVLPNPDISWETSEQLNIGFDSRFVNDRLGVVFDWYRKSTIDWLVQAPVLAIYGTNAPFINGGDIENKGVELGLNWNETIGDFRYGISLNGAYNQNEVKRIENDEGIIHGADNVLSQGTTEMYRAQVGYPVGYFFGYKTDGIFQNAEQITDYRARGLGVLATAQPGDVIFTDTNGDGTITTDDRVMIGNPHPDFTGGMSLNFGYKGLDLSVTATGAFGHQIAKSYRSFADSPLQNYTTEVFERWHGEGTSNRYPRLTSGSHTNSQYVSDIYIENGDFVKIQNVTLGYDFKSLLPKMPFGQARLYLTAQNLYTFTGYSGMDPEIGYGYDQSWVSGIDLGFYPSPRTFLLGLNLKF
ncbi:SusC/RagA family TonB-linked outer membrane protein [Parapedobacter sp. DT-150]|uniref:SusC/RagA family TonB-linked outer membrane protein n=1 Tax=Parapedobacter sp. DT-150 TaxID=3396162 RepID=UPI003F1E1D17